MLLPGCARTPAAASGRDIAALEAAPLYTFSEAELDRYLRHGPMRDRPLAERVEHFATRLIGQPYRLHLLGEHPVERHDPDPLYCLSASDCVTFVEHVYAMALARDWDSFHDRLMALRYRDARIGILHRNHFTEADWNVNNAWLFGDVTALVAGGDAAPMTLTVDRAAFFRTFKLETDFKSQRFETVYLPVKKTRRRLSDLRTGDVLEFVRGTPEAPYVAHMGLAIRSGDAVDLIHSGKPAVSRLPLTDYFKRSSGTIGIKILRPRAGGVPPP